MSKVIYFIDDNEEVLKILYNSAKKDVKVKNLDKEKILIEDAVQGITIRYINIKIDENITTLKELKENTEREIEFKNLNENSDAINVEKLASEIKEDCIGKEVEICCDICLNEQYHDNTETAKKVCTDFLKDLLKNVLSEVKLTIYSRFKFTGIEKGIIAKLEEENQELDWKYAYLPITTADPNNIQLRKDEDRKAISAYETVGKLNAKNKKDGEFIEKLLKLFKSKDRFAYFWGYVLSRFIIR